MADVRRPAGEAGRGREEGRGQLLLVAGFALAVTLVQLALILNMAIYTENLATRDDGLSPSEVVDSQGALEQATADTLTYINTHNQGNISHGQLTQNLTAAIRDRTNASGLHSAGNGVGITVSVDGTTPGMRVRQTNVSRKYTSGGTSPGRTGWTLAEHAKGVTNGTLAVRDDYLYEATSSTSAAALNREGFHVHIEDASNASHRWNVYVFEGAATGTKYVLVEDPTEDFQNSTDGYVDFIGDSCTGAGNVVRVELMTASVDNTRCPQLGFTNDLPAAVNVEYVNGGRGSGTYEWFLRTSSLNQSNYYTAGSGDSPFTVTALYAANLTHTRHSHALDYSSRTSVEAPRRGLGAFVDGAKPAITTFDVTDRSVLGSDVTFDVNWSVTDSDGDLYRVETALISDEDDTVLEWENRSVSGTNASMEVTVDTLSLDSDATYEIQVIVFDQNGHRVTAAQRHEADGDGSGDPP